MSPPRVVGIDPSLTATGVVRSNGQTHRIGQTGITKLPHADQVKIMDHMVLEVWHFAAAFRPDLVVIEHPNMGQAYGGNLQRSYLWWRLLALAAPTPVASVDVPHRFKYLTGKGSNVTKKAVVQGVAQLAPWIDIGTDDNLADAAVYMLMGMRWLEYPLDDSPHGDKTVNDPKVRWPERPERAGEQ